MDEVCLVKKTAKMVQHLGDTNKEIDERKK